jgi:hypothetical protein
MAELGVVGSAVGIVSLGIQVCQGLLKYYGAWKDSQKDISTMYTSVNNFISILKQLEKKLSHPSLDEETAKDVSSSILACKGGICALEDELAKA